MTKAQDTYNEFIIQKVTCPSCKKEVSFQQVVEWGYERGQLKCPFCKVLIKHYNNEAIEAAERLALLDKVIAEEILEFTVDGELHNHPASEAVIWAALTVVQKSQNLAVNIPLSYIPRMFLIQLYHKLVDAGDIIEPNFYHVQAPIPVDIDGQAKVAPIRHYSGGGIGGRRKRKKKKVGTQLTIGGMTSAGEGSEKLMDLLADLEGGDEDG